MAESKRYYWLKLKDDFFQSKRIKKLRKKKGMTQLELAEKVYVTDKAVSKWETGEGNPEITILIELAKVFEVSLDYLLTGKCNNQLGGLSLW